MNLLRWKTPVIGMVAAGIFLRANAGSEPPVPAGGGGEGVAFVEASLVPIEERPDGRPIYTHRLDASVRLIRFDGAMPPAEGMLAFLADDAALRAGTIALTKEQADAALAALSRATGQDVSSTLRVSVAVGNPARMVTGQEVRYPVGWKKASATDGGWLASKVETRTIGVGLTVSAQLVTDGRIQLNATVDTTELAGFVEHDEPSEKTTVGEEVLALLALKPGKQAPAVNMGPHAKPVFEPVFSTHETTARFRMKPGETVVLRGDVPRATPGQEGAPSRRGTMLVFLTATVEPITKSDPVTRSSLR